MECHEKILIVEDDAQINALLARILKREGYRTHSAYSGSEAKMCLAQEEYALVLLDLMLPGLTGEELLSEIRKDKPQIVN